MRIPINTYVDFLSDFPFPESFSPDFVPGEEVAQFLAAGLDKQDVKVLGVEEQEPALGREILCMCEGQRFSIRVSVDLWDDIGRWCLLTAMLNKKGRAGPLCGQAELDALTRFLIKVNEVLRDSAAIRDIRWFPHFDTSEYLEIQEPGDGPIRDPEADSRLPFVLRFERLLENIPRQFIVFFIAVIIIVSLLNPNLGVTVVKVSIATLLVCIIVAPIFTSTWVRHLARHRRKQRRAREASR